MVHRSNWLKYIRICQIVHVDKCQKYNYTDIQRKFPIQKYHWNILKELSINLGKKELGFREWRCFPVAMQSCQLGVTVYDGHRHAKLMWTVLSLFCSFSFSLSLMFSINQPKWTQAITLLFPLIIVSVLL